MAQHAPTTCQTDYYPLDKNNYIPGQIFFISSLSLTYNTVPLIFDVISADWIKMRHSNDCFYTGQKLFILILILILYPFSILLRICHKGESCLTQHVTIGGLSGMSRDFIFLDLLTLLVKSLCSVVVKFNVGSIICRLYFYNFSLPLRSGKQYCFHIS